MRYRPDGGRTPAAGTPKTSEQKEAVMADEIIVRTWDDMHLYHAGDRVEAEHGVKTRLALGGRDYDLDLTAEHRDELEKLLQPWLDAGQAASKSQGGPSLRAVSPGRPKGRRDSFKAGEPRP